MALVVAQPGQKGQGDACQSGFAVFAAEAVSNPKMQIVGTDCQILEVKLSKGDKLRSEPGTMCHISENIKCSVSTGGCCGAGARSAIAGETFFYTDYTIKEDENGEGYVGLTPNFPSTIIPLDLSKTWVIKDGAFFAAMGVVRRSYRYVWSVGAACCGGQGAVLNVLGGSGTGFLNAGGTIVRKALSPGEEIIIDKECLVAMDDVLDFDVRAQGGCDPLLWCCSGEGMFVTVITNNTQEPRDLILQSMPIQKYAKAVASAMPKKSQSADGGGGGGGGE